MEKARVTPLGFIGTGRIARLAEETLVGTNRLRSLLPYRGPDGDWLEFQNVSITETSIPERLQCKASQSGCKNSGQAVPESA